MREIFGCKLGAKCTQFAPNLTDFSPPNHPVSLLESMAGTTGLEPATSAVTGQRSNQLSYVPTIVFSDNLDICHIESSVSQLSLFSLFSTISLLWTQFWASMDTKQTPRRHQNRHLQRQNQVYQIKPNLVSSLPSHRAKVSFPVRLFDAAGAPWRATPQVQAQPRYQEERTLGREERTAAPSSSSFRHSHRSSPRSDLRPDQAA